MAPRPPRGYVGADHLTIGSDLLAVPETLEYLGRQGGLGPRLVLEKILRTESVRRLADVEPRGWYPIDWLLEMTDAVAERVGEFGLRRIGRTLFRRSHAPDVAGLLHCGVDVVTGIDAMYRRANRGSAIGGWHVLEVDSARATLEKTTPHHCALEEGILAEALATVGSRAVVIQDECRLSGSANACRFVIESLGGAWLRPSDELEPPMFDLR